MKRDPSIHVRRSSLTKALKEEVGPLFDTEVMGDLDENIAELVDALFHSLKGEAIRNRVVIQAKASTKKKMERVASVDKKVAEQFHAMYQLVNSKHNIKTTTIKATDGKYATLKEVAQHAKEFCDMFSLDQENGFQAYITIGIRLAKNNYSIYKLKALGDRILKEYENVLAISEDDDKGGTAAFYAAWRNVNIKYVGSTPSITEPHMFSHFLIARKAADKQEALYHDWIAAQYERMASYDTTPHLSQLYGDNAALAYTQYMGSKTKESDEEKKYFSKEAKVKAKTIKRKGSSSKK